MRRLIAVPCLLAVPLAGAEAVATVSPVTLAGKGLGVRGSIVRFGTARTTAVPAIAAALGAATKAGVYSECGGDHPIAYVQFRGGVELSFVDGKFVGWTLESEGDRRIATVNGVGIGASVKTLQRLFPDVVIDPGNEEGGGIGPNFSSGTWVNGWLDGITPTSKVISMYPGETCIVE